MSTDLEYSISLAESYKKGLYKRRGEFCNDLLHQGCKLDFNDIVTRLKYGEFYLNLKKQNVKVLPSSERQIRLFQNKILSLHYVEAWKIFTNFCETNHRELEDTMYLLKKIVPIEMIRKSSLPKRPVKKAKFEKSEKPNKPPENIFLNITKVLNIKDENDIRSGSAMSNGKRVWICQNKKTDTYASYEPFLVQLPLYEPDFQVGYLLKPEYSMYVLFFGNANDLRIEHFDQDLVHCEFQKIQEIDDDSDVELL